MNAICLPEIFIANLFGLLLMIGIMMSKFWRFQKQDVEYKILRLMVICVIISCIADPICFVTDGKPGIICRLAVYGGNLWIYFANLIMCPLWALLINYHIGGSNIKIHIKMTMGVATIGLILLLINFIFPILFSVDQNNIYARECLFWVFNLMAAFFILDGLVILIMAKVKGGVLKFFPVAQFFVPIIVGIIIQGLYYGVSTIWPGIAVGITCMMLGLQNEKVFLDNLTGLFNRYYLYEIQRKWKMDRSIAVIMLDLNDFKAINDTYGHLEGDEALIKVSQILRDSVENQGNAIRYAGDEFLMLLNTDKKEEAEECIERIKYRTRKYNEHSHKAYTLSVSIGYGIFNFNEKTLDEIMKEVDARMYEDKESYYMNNGKCRRK